MAEAPVDQEVQDLAAAESLSLDDLLYVVQDPAGTPASKKLPIGDLADLIGGGAAIGGAVTDGTAGSLLFVGSGPVLAQDNAALFWDASNKRLGIGTTAPGSVLALSRDGAASDLTVESFHTSGSNRAQVTTRTATGSRSSPGDVATGNQIGEFLCAGYAGGAFRTAAGITMEVDAGTVSGSSLPGRIIFETAPNGSVTRVERMRITQDGKVGIGTNAPVLKLHVNSDSGSAHMRVQSPPANYATLSMMSGTKDWQISHSQDGTNYLAFWEDGSDARMILPEGGGIAIQDGITAPSPLSGWARIFVDVADGDLKVIYGDGTVKTIVVDT